MNWWWVILGMFMVIGVAGSALIHVIGHTPPEDNGRVTKGRRGHGDRH